MRRILVTAALLISGLSAAPAAAQQNAEEEAVKAVVVRLFDGMRARDTAMMRSVFSEHALFYGLDRQGNIDVTRPDEFIAGIPGAAPGMKLDEVLHDVEVRIDGPLATVWTYYDFFVGDNFSHCGYDALQLLKTQGQWKIVALADTRRREGCRQQRG